MPRWGRSLAIVIAALWACAGLAPAAAASDAGPLRVGSKAFTESELLGALLTQVLDRHHPTVHRRALGGTRVLWRALLQDEIDLYVEYTGTLRQELLPQAAPGEAGLAAALAAQGLRLGPALGFANSYAIGMPEARAAALGIDTLSDLRAHPQLRLGLSHEFIDRGDGWRGLKSHYRLPQRATGLDHDLAYRALAAGTLDAVDLYTTDAEIPYYGLRVLRDDRGYFPDYQARIIYRAEHAQALAPRLQPLAGALDTARMQRLNAAVKLDRRPVPEVAAAFASEVLGLAPRAAVGSHRAARLLRRTGEHLALVGLSLGAAIIIAIPLGVLAQRRRRLGQWILSATGILQTVPALAMLVFMIPLFGIGGPPAIAALFLYSLLPIVRNTHAGLAGIDPALRESALTLGLSARTRLLRIELPLATRHMLAGIKTAAVINIGTATLGALVGAGGYGQPILSGIRLDDLGLILEGAVPAALLALAAQGGFELLERRLLPAPLRRAG